MTYLLVILLGYLNYNNRNLMVILDIIILHYNNNYYAS